MVTQRNDLRAAQQTLASFRPPAVVQPTFQPPAVIQPPIIAAHAQTVQSAANATSSVASAAHAEHEAIRQSIFNRTKDLTIQEAHKLGFRAPKIGTLKGFDKTTGKIDYNTEWQGGMEKAQQVFESLKKELGSNRKLIKEVVELKKGIQRIFYEFEDGSSIQFRSLGKSGHPKIDIIDTLKNIEEKITFK